MITRRTVFAVLILTLWACLPVRAAVIDFTIEGVVTHSGRPEVSVGDPFTIHYSADSQDLNTNPTFGTYAATTATIVFPQASFTSTAGYPFVWVVLDRDDGTDYVAYVDADAFSRFVVDFTFPAGTLTSDALPLALPLSAATNAGFWDPWVVGVAGTVHSYIPEPHGLALFVPLAIMMRRTRGDKGKTRSPRRDQEAGYGAHRK